MFGRSLLFILFFLALSWIGYVGFTMISSSSAPPTPENCFSGTETVVAIHHPNEIDLNDSILMDIPKHPFINQLLHQPERTQHFYLNQSFGKILLERSKPWNYELITEYFNTLHLSVSIATDKSFRVSNGWKGMFHDKFLFLTDQPLSLHYHVSKAWKYVDLKASYSLLYPDDQSGFRVVNKYRVGTDKSTYYTSSNTQGLPLIADQEVFQDIIPENISTYCFYQRDYAQQCFGNESIAYEWMQYGMALLIKQKDTCFVSDFKPGQNPISILEESKGYTPINDRSGTLRSQVIPPFTSGENLQVEVFNNYVFIARKKALINEIIGAYETGNTLAQSAGKRALLFSNMPYRVSYRSISPTEQVTKSVLDQSICTIHQPLGETREEVPKNTFNPFIPIRLDDHIRFISQVDGTNKLIVTTANNTIYCVDRNKMLWSKTLTDAILAKPLISGERMYIPTEKGISGLQLNGGELAGFPLQIGEVKANLYEYIWRGKPGIAYATSDEVGAFSPGGKILFTLAKNHSEVVDMAVQGKNGELIIHTANATSWVMYNINRKRKVKEFSLSEGNWKLNKYNREIALIGVSKHQLVRINDRNQVSLLIGNCSNLLRVQHVGENQVYFATQDKTIFLVTDNGRLLSQFTTTLNNLEDAALFKLSNGKTIVGIIDGIANNCYIYRLNGNELNKESYEGSNRIAFQKMTDGSMVLVSQANGYLVRYPLNY